MRYLLLLALLTSCGNDRTLIVTKKHKLTNAEKLASCIKSLSEVTGSLHYAEGACEEQRKDNFNYSRFKRYKKCRRHHSSHFCFKRYIKD